MHIKDLTTDTDNVSQILVHYAGRDHSGRRKATVWCLSLRVSVWLFFVLTIMWLLTLPTYYVVQNLCNSRVSVRPYVRPPVCPSMEVGYTWFAPFLENINRVSTLTVIVASEFWAYRCLFLPRDAMLARYTLSLCVRPSVRHKSVYIETTGRIELVLAWMIPSTYPTSL